ncbi:MAG: hypothetical protein AB7T49_09080 [Oligoflexales bacterium]
MKRLTLPYKRFRPSKIVLQYTLVILASTAALSELSCKERSAAESASSIASLETTYDSIKLFATPTGSKPATVAYASFSTESCLDPSAEAAWNISFFSSLGAHGATVRLGPTTTPTLAIDAQTMTLPKAPESLAVAKTELCKAYAADQRETYDLRAVNTQLQAFLASVAPTCTFSWESQGLFCKLSQTNSHVLEEELGDIQAHMLRRWTRQPYLITRRLAVTKGLANLLNGGQFGEKRTDYCRIIESSLPEELPVSMRTSRWQKAVCYGSVSEATAVANFGISEALAEIKSLKQQVEENSKQGLLTVRIPSDLAPSKDFWVTLSPLADKGEMDGENAGHLASFCWHPLYQENANFLYLGRVMHLITDSPTCTTSTLSTLKPERQIANYVIDSITSETEFPITNGRSKLLSLPYGSYQYSIQPYSPALEPWEAPDPANVKTGTINWEKTHSKAQISTW